MRVLIPEPVEGTVIDEQRSLLLSVGLIGVMVAFVRVSRCGQLRMFSGPWLAVRFLADFRGAIPVYLRLFGVS